MTITEDMLEVWEFRNIKTSRRTDSLCKWAAPLWTTPASHFKKENFSSPLDMRLAGSQVTWARHGGNDRSNIVQQLSESYNGGMFAECNCLKSPFVENNRRPNITGHIEFSMVVNHKQSTTFA
jgi:hypothetical protein